MKTSWTSPVLPMNHNVRRCQVRRYVLLRLGHALGRNLPGAAARFLLIGLTVVVCTSPAFAAEKDLIDRISEASVFYQRLRPVGTTSPGAAENQELGKIVASARTNGLTVVTPEIEKFLVVHSNSPWAPSLLANLGYNYRERGIYSKALTHWERVWELTRDDKTGPGKAVADFTFAHWTKLLAALGKHKELEPLLKQTRGRVFDGGPLQQLVSEARESCILMKTDPDEASACGALALAAVANRVVGTNFDISTLGKPPSFGYSLADLVQLAEELGCDLVAVKWPEGKPLPIPSVVHGRSGHYIAVLEKQGDRCKVFDPSRPPACRLREDDIRQEASGGILVERESIKPDFVVLAKAEAQTLVGRGNVTSIGDPDDGCSNGSGGSDSPASTLASGAGGQGATTRELQDAPGAAGLAAQYAVDSAGGCGTCGGRPGTPGLPPNHPPPAPPSPPMCCPDSGMARWAVSDPYMSVWMWDQPIAYMPGLGSEISFKLAYKQRETRPFDSNFFSFGKMWDCSWFSYIADAWSYQEMEAPLGGHRNYTYGDTSPEYFSHTSLDRQTDQNGMLAGYVVTHADGAVDYYSSKPSFALNGDTVEFLTDQVDRFGNTNHFVYEETNSAFLLRYVVDPDGHTNTLAYEDASFPTQVTSVTDPYGRTATLEYDAATGMLTNITDPEAISSSFAYDSLGWATSMTTPYGTTSFIIATNNPGVSGDTEFDQGTNASYSFIIRSVVVADPAGGTNIWMLRQDSGYVYNPSDDSYDAPLLVGAFPASVVPDVPYGVLETNDWRRWRNSFHWGPWQAAFVGGDLARFTPNDFAKSRIRHWSHGDSGLSQNLAWELEPSPDGTTNTTGQVTFFDYEGQIYYGWYTGTQSLPAVIARVIPDGTSWYTWYQRDEWGHATNVIDTWSAGYGGTTWSRTNSYIYDGADMIEHIGPDDDVLTGYAYDSNHHMLRATNAVGEVTYLTHDTKGRLTSVTTPSGLVRTNVYFTSGTDINRLSKTYEYSGSEYYRSNAFTYADGLVSTRTDERGVTTTSYWDSLRQLTGISYPDGSSISNRYTILDLTATKDRLGYWTYYLFDADRHLISETNANGVVTGYEYCPCGLLSSQTNAFGTLAQQVITFTYDYQGNRTYTYMPDSTFTVWYNSLRQPSITYDGVGYRYFLYNNQGLLNVVSNAFGIEKQIVYDDHDRPVWVTDANGVTVTNTYDPLSRLATRTYPDGGVEKFGYSASGLVAYTNQIGKVTRFAYNAASWKTFETNANSELLQYQYDQSGNLSELVDGKSQATVWHYDEYGRVTNKLDQAGTEILRYAYNAGNRLTSRWSAAKGTTSYAYDPVGNLTNIDYPASTDVQFKYDPLNRLTNMVDAVGATVYTYTSGGQLSTEDGPLSNDTVTSTYTNRMRVALSLQQPTGSWTNGFTYDAAHRISSITSPAGTFDYSFILTPSTLVSALSLPNGSSIYNYFDSVARLTRTELDTSGSTVLDSASYGYNSANQRTTFTNAAGTYLQYSYDDIGQLKIANSSVNTEDRGYTYDAAWNLNWRTNNGTAYHFQVNTLNELTNDPDASVDVYDSNGNLTERWDFGFQIYTYTYDDENRLTSVYYEDFGTPLYESIFAYDGLGRMRARADYYNALGSELSYVGTTYYIYDGNRVIQERDSNNVPVVSYTRGLDLSGTLEGAGGIGGLLARSHGYSSGNWSTHNYYHADGNGNITYLETSAQGLAASYRYDPFGNTTSQSGTLADANTYRFSSKEINTYSGMYYYLYRFYDPAAQRWLSRDPCGELGGVNLYGYVRNDPEDNQDPVGLSFIGDLWGKIKKHIKCSRAMKAWQKKCLDNLPKCDSGNAWDLAEYYTEHMKAVAKCMKDSKDMFKKCMEDAYDVDLPKPVEPPYEEPPEGPEPPEPPETE